MAEPDSWSVTLSKEDVELCWAAARAAATSPRNDGEAPRTVGEAFRKNVEDLAKVRRAIAAGDVIFFDKYGAALFWAGRQDGNPEIKGPYGIPQADGSIEVRQDVPSSWPRLAPRTTTDPEQG